MTKLRFAALVAAALIASFVLVRAGPQLYTPVNTAPYQWKADGFAQVTVTSTSQTLVAMLAGLTPAQVIPANAACATIIVETNDIRWRDDGTAPTASVGMLWTHVVSGTTPNSPWLYCGDDLTALRIIAVSGSPVLDISFTH